MNNPFVWTTIGGLVIIFGSFIFAALNFRKIFQENAEGFNFVSLFKSHIGAMIGMAFGGMMTVISIIILVIQWIQ